MEGIWLRLSSEVRKIKTEPSPSDSGPRGFPPFHLQVHLHRESPPHPGTGPCSQAHTVLSISQIWDRLKFLPTPTPWAVCRGHVVQEMRDSIHLKPLRLSFYMVAAHPSFDQTG